MHRIGSRTTRFWHQNRLTFGPRRPDVAPFGIAVLWRWRGGDRRRRSFQRIPGYSLTSNVLRCFPVVFLTGVVAFATCSHRFTSVLIVTMNKNYRRTTIAMEDAWSCPGRDAAIEGAFPVFSRFRDVTCGATEQSSYNGVRRQETLSSCCF